jgi:N-acetylmuramoyl-L-alanine amidase
MSTRSVRRARRATLVAVLVALGVAAPACGSGGGGAAPEPRPSEVPSTTSAPTATTAPPPPTTTTTTPPPAGTPTEPTAPGDEGPQVLALQQRLYDLGYFLDGVTGTYDASTAHAVMAFQKQHGIGRDGVAGAETVVALAWAAKVEPVGGTDAHLEVSLVDQVLVVVDGQGGAVAVDATTGKASTPTPPGTFSVFRQVDAWDPGPNGSLYRPKYFNGGIAVHGGPPVIASPASHGCVRVPNSAVDWLWSAGLAPVGIPVVVY